MVRQGRERDGIGHGVDFLGYSLAERGVQRAVNEIVRLRGAELAGRFVEVAVGQILHHGGRPGIRRAVA